MPEKQLQKPLGGIKAMKSEQYTFFWPEDPCWPDPSGNDPYDIGRRVT
jgi:hypothetical protein